LEIERTAPTGGKALTPERFYIESAAFPGKRDVAAAPNALPLLRPAAKRWSLFYTRQRKAALFFRLYRAAKAFCKHSDHLLPSKHLTACPFHSHFHPDLFNHEPDAAQTLVAAVATFFFTAG
jgi:hypothetical protein